MTYPNIIILVSHDTIFVRSLISPYKNRTTSARLAASPLSINAAVVRPFLPAVMSVVWRKWGVMRGWVVWKVCECITWVYLLYLLFIYSLIIYLLYYLLARCLYAGQRMGCLESAYHIEVYCIVGCNEIYTC